jgi:hypothetical protein
MVRQFPRVGCAPCAAGEGAVGTFGYAYPAVRAASQALPPPVRCRWTFPKPPPVNDWNFSAKLPKRGLVLPDRSDCIFIPAPPRSLLAARCPGVVRCGSAAEG